MRLFQSRKGRLWRAVIAWLIPVAVTVSGFQGFWLVVVMCVGAVLWTVYLFWDEISRVRIVQDPGTKPHAEHPFWLILPGVVMLLFALYPFVKLYLAATGYVAPLTPNDLLQTYIHDRSLYISDLARETSMVHGKTFENVEFIGPAFIGTAGVGLMVDSSFVTEGPFESSYLEVPDGTLTTGLIVFVDCTFRRCRFKHIQFLGTKNNIEKFKKSFQQKRP